jgi:rod shape-determining protein MreD
LRSGVWHRLDLVARNLLPALIAFSLVLVAMVPLRLPDVAPVVPALALVAVYYWAVHRRNLMPVWAVFLIGLFQDLLSGGLVGVGILSLLLVYGLVESLRRVMVNAPFAAVWLVFALVAAAALGAGWLLTCILEARLIDPEPQFFRYLTTLAVYPCLAWLFAQMQRAWLR